MTLASWHAGAQGVRMAPKPVFWILALVWFVLDQGTKALASSWLRHAPPVMVLPDFFQLTYSTNTGAAFGMFRTMPMVLPWLTFILLGWMIWMARYLDWSKWMINIGCALVAGGALGNIVDRVRFGHVVDFLDFWFWGWNYPTFNFADTGICVGLGLIVLADWRSKPVEGVKPT